MFYEYRKWLGYNSIRVLLAIIFILPIFTTLNFIVSHESYKVSNDEIIEVSGFDALKNSIKLSYEKDHFLTNERINEALSFLQDNWEDENIYKYMEIKYPGYYSILFSAFQSPIDGNKQNIMSENNKDSFYTQIDKRREENFLIQNQDLNEDLNNDIKNFFKEESSKIKIPFIMGEISSWIILIKSYNLSFLALLYIIALIGSVIYSIDKETRMDIVLYGDKKVLREIKMKKLLAFLVFQIVAILYITLACNLILFIIGGLRSSVSIQVLPQFLTSLHPFNTNELMIYYFIIAGAGIISIGCLISFINCSFENYIIGSLIGIILVSTLVYLANKSMLPSLVKDIILLSPITSINCLRLITDLSHYNFGGLKLNLLQANLVFSIITSMVFILLYFRMRLRIE